MYHEKQLGQTVQSVAKNISCMMVDVTWEAAGADSATSG